MAFYSTFPYLKDCTVTNNVAASTALFLLKHLTKQYED